jgi:hypothetical protein
MDGKSKKSISALREATSISVMEELFKRELDKSNYYQQIANLEDNPTPLQEFFARLLIDEAAEKDAQELKNFWVNVYKKWFDHKLDVSSIVVPAIYDPAKYWGVIVDYPLGLDKTFSGLGKRMPAKSLYQFFDGVEDVTLNFRRNYLILVEKKAMAFKDVFNFSKEIDVYNELEPGLTLKEGMLLEIAHLELTGKHLDPTETATVCIGSIDKDFHYPSIYYHDNDYFLVSHGSVAEFQRPEYVFRPVAWRRQPWF